MKESIYNKLFDLHYRDLKLMTGLIYDWCGLIIPIEVIKIDQIRIRISIFSELMPYLFGELLKTYRVKHDLGYLEIYLKKQNKYKGEIYEMYPYKYNEGGKIVFSLYFNWVVISSKYLNTEIKINPAIPTRWIILDRKYINIHKYRADSRKEMSVVDLEKLIFKHFSDHAWEESDFIKSILHILFILDKSIRELENENVYIFPRFFKNLINPTFGIFWNIYIIPETIKAYYYVQKKNISIYLPYIGLSVDIF